MQKQFQLILLLIGIIPRIHRHRSLSGLVDYRRSSYIPEQHQPADYGGCRIGHHAPIRGAANDAKL